MLQAVTDDGVELCSTVVESRTRVPVPFPAGCSSFHFRVIGGGYVSPHDPRIVNFRVFRCWWGSGEKDPDDEGRTAARSQSQAKQASLLTMALHPFASLQSLATRIANGGPVVQIPVPVGPLMAGLARIFAKTGGTVDPRPVAPEYTVVSVPECARSSALSPLFLHTNACGDFTLMGREQWFDLRGYPEFDVFSMNIDSVLCCAAHHAGFCEEILRDPMRIYHIEHQTGSGWTPEGRAELFARIAARGIPWLEYREYVVWAAQMRRFNSTMIFNRKDWGLANDEFTEITLPATVEAAPA